MQKATEHTFSYPAGRVVFSATRPRCYAIATYLNSGDGSDAVNAVRDAIRQMFENTDALIIEAVIDHDNKASKRVAYMVGLREVDRDDRESFRKLKISTWLRTNESVKAKAKRLPR